MKDFRWLRPCATCARCGIFRSASCCKNGRARTYISKIENGKAMPTLSSLDRLARALQVDISALLRDTPNHHRDETAVLMADPFLAEIAKFSTHLTSTQKSIFLNHVRELAQASGQAGKNGIRRSA